VSRPGFEPPTDWAEMKTACETIKADSANADLGCYAGQLNTYD
jgi:hypothetical protein